MPAKRGLTIYFRGNWLDGLSGSPLISPTERLESSSQHSSVPSLKCSLIGENEKRSETQRTRWWRLSSGWFWFGLTSHRLSAQHPVPRRGDAINGLRKSSPSLTVSNKDITPKPLFHICHLPHPLKVWKAPPGKNKVFLAGLLGIP